MTQDNAQNKAEELFQKFETIICEESNKHDYRLLAKRCAFVAIEQMLNWEKAHPFAIRENIDYLLLVQKKISEM